MLKRDLSTDETGTLVLLGAIIFGAWFRIMPAWLADFPINDGGMFYAMISDLQANHFILPLFTSYNYLSIPFAYPPLGFYIGAGISSLFNIPVLDIIRWLPGIINALCIPAFYFLAKEALDNRLHGAAATLAYAMTPHLTSWLSMGGGLTRSLGMLFMLLTLGYVHRVFSKEDKHSIFAAILFGALTVLSHTEAPIYTIVIAFYIWIMKSRSLKGMLNGIIIAAGVLAVSAPWYGAILYRHGLGPFLSIAQTGAHSLAAFFKVLNIAALTEEPYLGLLGAVGVLGIATLVAKKDYFIPLMLPVIFLAQPRSAHIMGNIPLAMAAGFFIVEVILPGILKIQADSKKLTAFAMLLFIYMFSNSIYYGLSLSGRHLTNPEITAMQWIEKNTAKESRFLVLSGNENAYCDPVTEWFPTLANRGSLTTIQGSEWLLGSKFSENVLQAQKLQGCIDEGMACFTQESNYFGSSYDYVYISISSAANGCDLLHSSTRITRGLVAAMEDSGEYSIAYLSEKSILFKKK